MASQSGREVARRSWECYHMKGLTVSQWKQGFNMEGCIRLVWMSLLICGVECNTENVINSIDGVKEEMLQVEQRLMNHMDSVKMSVETGFKEQMDQQRQALEEIIKGDSFKDVLRSEVVAEIKQLRRGQNKMNRQLRRVLNSLRELQKERQCKTYKQNVKADGDMPNTTTASVHVNRETNPLTTTMIPSVKTALSEREVATTSSPDTRTRIIVAPLFSWAAHQFLDVSMDNNSIHNYTLRGMDRVLAIAYAAQSRKLLIATFTKKIIASPLDTDQEEILLDDVKSYGMAVDEVRQIIFLTTEHPNYSISRMTTEGENFTRVINLTYSGYYPRAVAVDPQERKIYACNYVSVFSVMYDGQGLRTLEEGRNMNSLSLDNTGTYLYYNRNFMLEKMSLAGKFTSSVAELSKIPWTSRYYRNKIYFSSSYDDRERFGSGMIGAVDLENGGTARTLRSFNMYGSNSYAICLVP